MARRSLWRRRLPPSLQEWLPETHIARFRRENRKAFGEAFVKVLAIAGQSGLVKKIGGISVDGTKIKANASKHAAVSYERAGELIEQLTLEVEELERKAEEADSTPLDDGLSIPEEVTRREDRKARLEQARQVIEERYEQQRQIAQQQYEEKMAEREAKRQQGKPSRGRHPKPPPEAPPAKRGGTRQLRMYRDPNIEHRTPNVQRRSQARRDGRRPFRTPFDVERSMFNVRCCLVDWQLPTPQYSSTDPESSIMKAGNGYFCAEQIKSLSKSG